MAAQGPRPTHHFVGRHAEIDQLNAALERASNGAQLVLIEGEAGIGKTRLISEFLDAAAARLGWSARTRCSPTQGHPLDVLEMLLTRAGSSRPEFGGILRDLVDSLTVTGQNGAVDPTSDPMDRELATRRAYRGTVRTIVEALDATPAVLVFDDLHWASPTLLDLLVFLVDELEVQRPAPSVLIVCATRTLPPGHSTQQLKDRLARSAAASHLAVGGLAEDAEAEIAGAHLGTGIDIDLLGQIRRASRGNPLCTKAALDLIQRRSDTSDRAGLSPTPTPGLAVVSLPDDPITEWIAGLPDPILDVLEPCAALARPFTDADANTLCVHDSPREQLDAAVERGVLESDGQLHWFAHELYRERLYERLAPSSRPDVHRRCVELTATNAGSGQAMEAGRHVLLAGDLVEAPRRADLLRRAALAAFGQTAWADSATFLAAALAVAPEASTAADHLLLGQAHYLNANHPAALESLDRALAVAQYTPELTADFDPATDRDLATVWSSALITTTRIRNTTDMASLRRPPDRTAADAFLRRCTDARQRSLVIQVTAESLIGAGRIDEGLQAAEEAERFARESGDPAARSLAAYATSYALMTGLEPERAIPHLRAAVRFADRGDEWFLRSAMRSKLPFPLMAVGELADAVAAAEDAVAFAGAGHEFSGQALGHAVAAAASTARGDFDWSLRCYELGRSATVRSQYVLAGFFLAPVAVLNCLQRSDLTGARAVLADWPGLPPSVTDRLRDVIEGAPVGPPRPLPRPTELGAGLLAIDALLLSRRPDLERLDHLVDLARRCQQGGMEFPSSFPVSISRVVADALAAAGRADEAASSYADAVARSRAAGAQAELAAACLGWAELVDADTPTGDGSLATSLRDEGLVIAHRLGLSSERVRTAAASGSSPTVGPSHTIILISDVVGSTDISRRLGDRQYYHLVSEHHRLVRQAAGASGHEFSEGGDSLYFWFDDAGAALATALRVQELLDHWRSGSGEALQAKVVLGGGQPFFVEGRPYGLVLNRAARMLDFTGADEIRIDHDTATQLGRSLASVGGTASEETLELRGIGPTRTVRVRPFRGHLAVDRQV